MSETVEAVGYKADVPSRAKDKVSQTVDNVKNKVSDTATRAKEAMVGTASRAGDAMSETTSRVGDATPSGGQVKQQPSVRLGWRRRTRWGLPSARSRSASWPAWPSQVLGLRTSGWGRWPIR